MNTITIRKEYHRDVEAREARLREVGNHARETEDGEQLLGHGGEVDRRRRRSRSRWRRGRAMAETRRV